MKPWLDILFSLMAPLSATVLSGAQTPDGPETVKAEDQPFRIVGYVPSWRRGEQEIRYDKLTHVIYAFVTPRADGTLADLPRPAHLKRVVRLAHRANVKVSASIGGQGKRVDRAFEELTRSPSSIETLAGNAVATVEAYGLDGIDIDWEYPDPSSSNRFLALLKSLARALHDRHKLLSIAVSGSATGGEAIGAEVFDQVDFCNLMVYGKAHPKSTYADAVAALDFWSGRGMPPEKIVLGIPFFGLFPATGYRRLVAKHPDAPNRDRLGQIHYNGLATTRAKTQLARKRASGVVIWELSQDSRGQGSLLDAIFSTVKDERDR